MDRAGIIQLASYDSEIVREMRRQTEVFRSIDRRLDKIAYELRKQAICTSGSGAEGTKP